LRFVGIDLSTNPRDCGVCVIEGRAISHVGHGSSTFSHPDWLLRHCFDALVAALTTREYTSDNTYDPPEDVPEEALRVEGWIRIPSRALTGTPG